VQSPSPPPPDDEPPSPSEPARDGDPGMANSGTATLVERARNGDDRAWRELYVRNSGFLAMLVEARLRSDVRRRFDVDDVVQSAYLKAFHKLGEFEYRGTGSFKHWMARIVDRHLSDLSRHETRERRTPKSEVASEDGHRELPSDEPGPHTAVLQSEQDERVLAELAALDPVDRDIVVMRIWDKRTWSDIALEVGMPEARARGRYYKAMQVLSKRLS
jgi:RNA polymerase sigma-70 factor, ECF subfamily